MSEKTGRGLDNKWKLDMKPNHACNSSPLERITGRFSICLRVDDLYGPNIIFWFDTATQQ